MHSPSAHLAMALAASALAGCGFSAGFDGGRYRCDGDEGCPAGLTCSAEGYCEAGGGGDAAPPADAGGLEICGTTDALREAFDDETVFERLWRDDTSGPGSAVADGGQLALELGAGAAGFAGRRSMRWYRLEDSGVTLRVLEAPGGPSARLALQLTFTTGVEVQLVGYGDGEVSAVRNAGSGFQIIGSIGSDPLTEPFWRARDADGTLFLEVGDGSSWREVAKTASLPAQLVEVGIYLTDESAREAPVIAAVDDLNAGTTGRRCRASSFFDDFEDGLVDPGWQTWRFGTCDFREEGGRLRFQNMADVYTDCGYRSYAGFDMTGDRIEAEVPPPDSNAGALNMGLKVGDNQYYTFKLEDGAQTVTALHLGGSTVGSAPYDADSMRYWRIEHDEDTGQLTFLTSGDGATWTAFAATAGTDLDNVQIGLYASDFATSDGEVAFDRFNQLSQ